MSDTTESKANRNLPHDEAELREALATILGWRRGPALAICARGATIVEPHRAETGSDPTVDRFASTAAGGRERAFPSPAASDPYQLKESKAGDPMAAVQEDWTTSPAFDFGGLRVHVLAEPQTDQLSERLVPATVVDTALRMIVEAHFAVWYVWHVPTAFSLVPGLAELLQVPQKAVPTFTEEWFGIVHPDDLPRLVRENDEALRAVSSFRSEYRVRRGDGEYVWVSDWAIVLSGPDGQAEWMAGGIRDISIDKALEESRLESTQLHEALFKNAFMPAVLIDSDGSIADANRAALEFFDVDHTGMVGRAKSDVLPPNLLSYITQQTSDGQRDDKEQDTREIECDIAGAKKWLLATVAPFQARAGSMVFLLGADLTEHRRISDALAQSEMALRNKTQALEERNVALKVLFDQRRDDLEDLTRSISDNVEQLVLPTLDLLAESLSRRPERALVEAVALTMKDITRPLLARTDGTAPGAPGLSRREYQVLQLIKAGRTSEQIADILCLSPTTVTFHRGNIRRKMGLHGTGKRLAPEVIVTQLT